MDIDQTIGREGRGRGEPMNYRAAFSPKKPKLARPVIAQGVRFDVLRRDNFTCVYCGRSSPAVTLEVDHKIPVVAGGSDEKENLHTACFDCNRGKGAKIVPNQPIAVAPATSLVGLYGVRHIQDKRILWRFTIMSIHDASHCVVQLEQTQFDKPGALKLVSLADLATPEFSLFSVRDDWIWTWALLDARARDKDRRFAEATFFLETERDYEAAA